MNVIKNSSKLFYLTITAYILAVILWLLIFPTYFILLAFENAGGVIILIQEFASQIPKIYVGTLGMIAGSTYLFLLKTKKYLELKQLANSIIFLCLSLTLISSIY